MNRRNCLCAALLTVSIIWQYEVRCQTGTRDHFKIASEDCLIAPDSVKGSFYRLSDFCLDRKGNLLFWDPENCRILQFSTDGKYIGAMGRRGDGPGEFRKSFYTVSVSPVGQIYAIEPGITKKVMIFKRTGEFERQYNYMTTDFGVWNNVFLDKNLIAANITVMSKTPNKGIRSKASIAIVNLNDMSKKFIKEGAEREGGINTPEFTNIVSDGKGNFSFGLLSQKEYKIFLCDKSGILLKSISKKWDPVVIKGRNRQEYDKATEMRRLIGKKLAKGGSSEIESEPYYYAIRRIALDSHDNLWVFTCESQDDDMLFVDLYDKSGNFKRSFVLENDELGMQRLLRLLIWDKFLFAIVSDKDEIDHVYRYRLPEEIWR